MSVETDRSSFASSSAGSCSSPSPSAAVHSDQADTSPESLFAPVFERRKSYDSEASSLHSVTKQPSPTGSVAALGRLLKKVSLKNLRPELGPAHRTHTHPEPPIPLPSKHRDESPSPPGSHGIVPQLKSSASQIFNRTRKLSRPSRPAPPQPDSPPPTIPPLPTHSKTSSTSSSVMNLLTNEEMAAWVIQPRALPLPPVRSPALRHTPSLGSINHPHTPPLPDAVRRAQSMRKLHSRGVSQPSPSTVYSDQFSSFDMSRTSTGSSVMSATEAILATEPAPSAPFSPTAQAERAKIKVDPSKRDAVLHEMVATERTYVKLLAELVELYIVPAAAPVSFSSGKKDTVLPAAERKAVFGNIDAIHHFHAQVLLPDLERALTADGLNVDGTPREPALEMANVFIRNTAFLKIYSSYVNSFDAALARIQSWALDSSAGQHLSPRSSNTSSATTTTTSPTSSPSLSSSHSFDPSPMAALPTTPSKVPSKLLSSAQRKRIKSYLKRARADPRHSQISLESYLLLPVQRIPRYKMLLESLLSSTGVPAFTSFDPAVNAANAGALAPDPTVQLALELVCEMATSMNERKRESEGRQQLLYWQGRIAAKFKSPLVQPHRVLIRAGPMKLVRLGRITQPTTGEFVEGAGETVSFEPREESLIALLCTDMLVFVREPADPSDAHGLVSLFSVMRLSHAGQGEGDPAVSLYGADNTLRIRCDAKTVLFTQFATAQEARAWRDQINRQQSVHLLPTPAPTPQVS